MINILVHGLGQNESSWNKVKELLKENKIEVETPNLFNLAKNYQLNYENLYRIFVNYCNSFKEKLNMNGGFRQSALKINQFIIKQETWGKNEIEERANILGNEALKIWPYPDLSSGILKNYIDNKDKNNQYSLFHIIHYFTFLQD